MGEAISVNTRFAWRSRNVGLEHAKGKWLLFADADDFFVEDMYDIITSYVDSEVDVIFFKEKSVLSVFHSLIL